MTDVLPEEDIDEYLRGCVRIDPLTLSDEFVRLPSDFAYWSDQYKTAMERYLLTKAERERVWAGKYIIATERTMANGKPATVDYAKALVETDEDYQEAVAANIAAEVELARLKGVLEAVRTKREMVVSLGAQVRAEMQHDPMVRSQVSTQRMVDEQ